MAPQGAFEVSNHLTTHAVMPLCRITSRGQLLLHSRSRPGQDRDTCSPAPEQYRRGQRFPHGYVSTRQAQRETGGHKKARPRFAEREINMTKAPPRMRSQDGQAAKIRSFMLFCKPQSSRWREE